MRDKKTEFKKQVDINKMLLICLLVGCILCFILGVTLFIMGIRKPLPVILIFLLAFLASLVILLLSRDVFLTKRARDRKKQKYV